MDLVVRRLRSGVDAMTQVEQMVGVRIDLCDRASFEGGGVHGGRVAGGGSPRIDRAGKPPSSLPAMLSEDGGTPGAMHNAVMGVAGRRGI